MCASVHGYRRPKLREAARAGPREHAGSKPDCQTCADAVHIRDNHAWRGTARNRGISNNTTLLPWVYSQNARTDLQTHNESNPYASDRVCSDVYPLRGGSTRTVDEA